MPLSDLAIGSSFALPQELPGRVLAPHWVWAMVSVAGLIATVTDLRSMRIPNWLTLPLFAVGLTYSAVMGGGDGVRSSLAGAALAGGIYVLAYMMAGGGAGDAKLMLAIGSWLDLRQAAVLVLAVAVSGFVWGMVCVVRRGSIRDLPTHILGGLGLTFFQFRATLAGRTYHIGRPAESTNSGEEAAAAPKRPKHWYPYAPAIFVGTLAAWVYNYQVGFFR